VLSDLYLKKDNDQGKFLTPTYSKTGYEVAYIGKWHLASTGRRHEWLPPGRESFN
jgi:arylsulfatase A-like enzyme